jgi:hypothetical protein
MKDEALDSIADDPVGAAIEIKEEYNELRKGYRKNLYWCVARAYAVAFAMLTDKEAWAKFLEEDFWTDHRKKRPKMEDRGNALLHVMVFIFAQKSTYDRAWKYAKALDSFFRDMVPPHCIEPIIKQEGGLEKMAKTASHKGTEQEESAPSAAKTANEEKTTDTSRGKPSKAREKTRKYQFLVLKSCAPEVRNLTEGQKARMTIKVVKLQGKLYPGVIKFKALSA